MSVDRVHDDSDRAAGRQLQCPTLVGWSTHDDMEQLYGNPLDICRQPIVVPQRRRQPAAVRCKNKVRYCASPLVDAAPAGGLRSSCLDLDMPVSRVLRHHRHVEDDHVVCIGVQVTELSRRLARLTAQETQDSSYPFDQRDPKTAMGVASPRQASPVHIKSRSQRTLGKRCRIRPSSPNRRPGAVTMKMIPRTSRR